MNMVRFPAIFAITFSLALPAFMGCGGGSGSAPIPNYGSEEGLKIAEFISYFNDYKADAQKFKKSFAGTPPTNWKEFDKVRFEVVVGSPRVEGTSATASIAIQNESNLDVIATKEWTFTKVGENWKIKDAPLK